MSERLSVAIVGNLSALVGLQDFALATFAEATRVTRADLNLQDLDPGGSCTVRFGNATGGGGDGFSVTFTAPALLASGTGDFVVPAGGKLYARVISASGDPGNLSGNVEVSPALVASGASALVTVTAVKEFERITSSEHDARLSLLCDAVTRLFERYCRRPLLAVSIVGERQLGADSEDLVLSQEISDVDAVRENGATLSASEYAFEVSAFGTQRVLRRVDRWWTRGVAYEVDYQTGFATPPKDLTMLALSEVIAAWHQFKVSGQARLGMTQQVLDAGGTASFLEWELTKVTRLGLAPYRRLF